MTKRLSAINTVSVQELTPDTKRWMWEYKEFAHPMHIWIKPSIWMDDMTGKE